MNKHRVCRTPVFRRRIVAVMIGAGFSMYIAPAQAFVVDTGNEDIAVRFDTTVRYNLGFRMKDRKSGIANNPNFDEGNFLFDKHDVITNRLDLLGEFDINYKGRIGVRVSMVGWVDEAYGSRPAH